MKQTCSYVYFYESPLGKITLGSDGKSLISLCFEGEKYYCENFSEKYVEKNLKVFENVKSWLDIYFSGKQPTFMPEIKLNGSDFRVDVWNILQEIPYGETITYGEIAKKLAKSKEMKCISAQAIGGTVGHNPISIIIPCHRVIGANNNLTGYAGGLDKKMELLKLEGNDISQYQFF